MKYFECEDCGALYRTPTAAGDCCSGDDDHDRAEPLGAFAATDEHGSVVMTDGGQNLNEVETTSDDPYLIVDCEGCPFFIPRPNRLQLFRGRVHGLFWGHEIWQGEYHPNGKGGEAA